MSAAVPFRDRLSDAVRQALPKVFGSSADPIEQVDERARRLLPGLDVIVWEGDAATFEFTYVSPGAAAVLGHAPERWLQPGFWATQVVDEQDRRDAVAFCALATGQGQDHEFEYRARTADGRLRWVFDVVKVVRGPRVVPVRLRGIMLDITDDKRAAGEADSVPAWREPVGLQP